MRYLLVFVFYGFMISNSSGQATSVDTVFYPGAKNIQKIITSTGNKKNILSFYPGGTKSSEQNSTADVKDGFQYEWDVTGKLTSSKYYTNNLPDKKWEQWYSSGIKQFEKNYTIISVNGKQKSVLSGNYFENFTNGSPRVKANYDQDKKDGLWQVWFDNGLPKEKINYKADMISGEAEYWYNNGKKQSSQSFIIIKDSVKEKNVLNGLVISYYTNGAMRDSGNFTTGEKNGLHKSWFENGQLTETAIYKNDLMNGHRKKWFDNGQTEFEYTVYQSRDSLKHIFTKYDGAYIQNFKSGKPQKVYQYKNGLKNGVQLEYRDNGVKGTVSFYKDGLQTGVQVNYHSNQYVSDTTTFAIITRNDSLVSVKQGLYKSFYDTGELSQTLSYKNNQRDGVYKSYLRNGKLSEESFYENGLKTGLSTLWNEDGSIKEKNSYEIITDKKGGKKSVPSGYIVRMDAHGNVVSSKFCKNGMALYKTQEFFSDSTVQSEQFLLIPDDGGHAAGRHINYFDNGVIKSDAFYYESRAYGTQITWYKSGQPQSVTDDPNNYFHVSNTINWLSDGNVADIKAVYKSKDEKSSYTKEAAGKIREQLLKHKDAEIKYSNDSASYSRIQKYSDTQIQYEEYFKNEKLDSVFSAYFINGQKAARVEMKDGIANGKFTLWFGDGKVFKDGEYTNGIKTGKWIQYYANGNKYEEKLLSDPENQQLYSEKTDYYENGNKKKIDKDCRESLCSYNANYFEEGQMSSESKPVNDSVNQYLSWYKNGKLSERRFYSDKKENGLHEQWYENGQNKMKVNMIDGLQEGIFTSNHENGKTKYEGLVEKGLKQGEWKNYDEKGKLVNTTLYKNDRKLIAPPTSECACVDTSYHKIGYAPSLSSLAELEEVNKMAFNFHAPIDTFYNHLFFYDLQTSSGSSAGSYSFSVIAFEETYLSIPNKKGMKLIFNPCIISSHSRILLNINYSGEKESLNAGMEPERCALEFPQILLRKWDSKNNMPVTNNKGKQENARLYFSPYGISYNNDEFLEIEKPTDFCFTQSEINGTGVILKIDSAVFDFNPAKNNWKNDFNFVNLPLNTYLKKNGSYEFKEEDEQLKNFMGIYAPGADFLIPSFNENDSLTLEAKGKDLLISDKMIAGCILFKATLDKGLNYKIKVKNKEIETNEVAIESYFKRKLFNEVKVEYDVKTETLFVYFNFIRG
ncbi:MAG: hypothetical protein ABI723_18765 [Bacteroidia bacterium]